MVELMDRKYPDGIKCSKKHHQENALTMGSNPPRDELKAFVRAAQKNFFHPDKPSNTGVK